MAVAGAGLLPAASAHAVPQRAASPDLSCWGDSLTYGVGGGGEITYPDHLAELLGITSYNGGVIGERSSGIAARQGGRIPRATFPDPEEVLPRGMFKVYLDAGLAFYEKTQVIQEEGTLACRVGGVHGTLSKRDYSWEFTPYYFTRDDGSAQRPPNGDLTFDVSTQQYAPAQIYWAGHNDLRLVYGPTPSNPGRGGEFRQIVYDNIAAMTATRPPDYLVLSMLNGKGAGNGSTTNGVKTDFYKNVVEIVNPTLAATYGPAHYLDVRTWLVNDALAYGGITPSEQDKKDKKEDIPPASLTSRGQDPHLNPTGYKLLSEYLADNLVRLGWF